MSSPAAFAVMVAFFAATVGAGAGQAPGSARSYAFETTDPGCQAATLVSTGGPAPSNPRTLAIRWAGYANFELAYKGEVVLLDAAFDRGSVFPPLGFKVPDITRVDAILIGHGHADHMSDAAAVAIRTKALVVGAPLTAQKLLSQSVPANRVHACAPRRALQRSLAHHRARFSGDQRQESESDYRIEGLPRAGLSQYWHRRRQHALILRGLSWW